MSTPGAEGPQLPIRITVRVDFTDGTGHTYEVLGTDAIHLRDVSPAFFPEPVITQDTARRAAWFQQLETKLRAAEVTLATVTDWARRHDEVYGKAFGGPGAPVSDIRRGYANAVKDVTTILDTHGLPEDAPVEFGT